MSPHHPWWPISESSRSLPEPWRAGEGNARPLLPRPRRPRSTPARARVWPRALHPGAQPPSRRRPGGRPLPGSQARDCAPRGDSSCPFPAKPGRAKKIHATFQRKLCRGRCNRSPGAHRRPAGDSGARAPPARPPSEKKAQPRGDPAGGPRTPQPAAEPPPLGLAGARRRDSHRAIPGARDTAGPGRAAPSPPFPVPGLCPPGEEGVRSYLARASGCHRGGRRRARPPPAPKRASRQLLNLQVTPWGEGACALGLPGGGGARRAGGGGCREGVRRGGAGPQGRKARGLQAVFVALTATGSPRVAPRLPCHYLRQRPAPSPLVTQTFR